MKSKWLSYPALLAAFTAAYAIAAAIGYSMQVDDTFVSPVWPAAGIALAALLTRGYRIFPAIFVGAFMAQLAALSSSMAISTTSMVLISLMVAVGCTASALAGAFLINTFIGKRNIVETVVDVVKFVALAAIGSTAIGATVTTLALGFGGIIPWSEYGYLWWTWWTGAGVGVLLVVPVMVTCCISPKCIKSSRRVVEAVLFIAFFFITHQLAVGAWWPQLVDTHPLDNILASFFIFLLLLAVIRFEQLGSTVFVFFAWALLIWDTSRGLGPFVSDSSVESLLTLEHSMGLLAVFLMVLTATMNEHGDVVRKLRKSRDELEKRVRERTEQLSDANEELESEIAVRIRAEEQIREAGEKLKAQYKGIPIPTYTWQRVDDDFVLVDFNDAAEEITHGGIIKLIGQSVATLYSDRPDIQADMEKCYREKTVIKRDFEYQLRSTGKNQYLSTSYAFVPPDLVLAHAEDITDRKRAEEQVIMQSKVLEERNSDLAALYEVSTAISRTIDLKQLLMDVLKTITSLDLFKVEKKGGVLIVEGDRMHLAAHLGHPEEFIELHRKMKVGDCLCGLAAKTGEIIVSGNSEHDKNHSFHYPDMKPHGHVIVPLKVANRVVGVSYFYFPADFQISQRQLELLSTIGNQLGIAIENSRLFEETRRLSLHDSLTGLANRNLMNVELTRTFAESRRSGQPLSLIMMDLDYFKQHNDTYGHAAGDRLLRDIAQITKREIRGADIATRYGGEEFLIILPNTGIEKAYEVAERLRAAISSKPFYFNGGPPIHITVSLGVAERSGDMTSPDRLVMMADDALYEAKKGGRNCIRVWSPSCNFS
ncbi:MAG: diguanylate cyclase [Actinobacteria bacterium]|nr:diguanylate cyclase [Actinomycetota bacterium]